MTDLVEEVRSSFERSKVAQGMEGKGPVGVIREDEMELGPGFDAMREYYGNRLLAVTRRGYRHFAGSTMPHDADELLALTGEVMVPPYIILLLQSFSDGVMVGHESDYRVKMAIHFHLIDRLFQESSFRESSDQMARGFGDNDEVLNYFQEYFIGGLTHLSHITGFAHRNDADPSKVWDVWMLIGTATITASYLAGLKMGTAWHERDVLDGIEIATEEEPRGPEREDGPGQ